VDNIVFLLLNVPDLMFQIVNLEDCLLSLSEFDFIRQCIEIDYTERPEKNVYAQNMIPHE